MCLGTKPQQVGSGQETQLEDSGGATAHLWVKKYIF